LGGALLVGLPQSAHAATLYWVGGNGDNVGTNANDWSTTDPTACTDGAGNGTVPGTSDIATFDADCDSNATIAANWSVAGIDIKSGYIGTLTQSGANTLTVGSSNYTQADGTFTGGNGSITVGAFTLSGGTFTSTTGTLQVGNSTTGAWTHTAGGTFTHNSGTVKWAGANGATWNVATSETFNNFEVAASSNGKTLTIASGDTIVVNGTLTLTDGKVGTGTLEGKGTISVASTMDGGTGIILVDGAGDQSFSIPNGTVFPGLTLNQSSTTVSFAAGATATIDGAFTLQAGTFTASSGTTKFGAAETNGSLTISGGTFNHNSGTIQWAGANGATWNVNTSLALNDLNVAATSAGKTFTVASGDTITVAGTLTQTKGGIASGGTLEADGDVTVVASTADGGTGTITFGGSSNQTFTHTGATQTSGILPLININKTGGTLTFAAGIIRTTNNWTYTAGTLDATTNDSTVVFGSASLTITGSHTLDNVNFNGGSAVNYTIANSNTLTVAGTLTLTDGLINQTTIPATGSVSAQGNVTVGSTWDGGTGTLVFSSSGTQTFDLTGAEALFNGDVKVNKSGGQVNLASTFTADAASQDLIIEEGTFDLNGNNLTVNGTSGQLDVESGGNLQLQGGETITANASNPDLQVGSTVIYNGTGSYLTSLAAGNTYSNLTFNGSGGVWEPNGAVTVNSNLTITAGTLDIDGQNLTVTSTFSNSGTLRLTGGETTVSLTNDTDSGTVEYDGTSTYTSLKAGNTYNNIIFNGSTGDWTHTGTLDVNGNLTITAGTLQSGGQNITLAGNWSKSGTYTSGSNTVTFDGAVAQTLTGETFYNLTINNTHASPDDTNDVDSSTAVTITNTLTVTDGQF